MDLKFISSIVVVLLYVLWEANGFCNNPVLLMNEQISNQTYTCSQANMTLTNPLSCCWMIPPISGLKLRVIRLAPTDSLIINEIGVNNDVTPIWHGNHTCSIAGVEKCPFKVTNILFSNVMAYRLIEIGMDNMMTLTRIIHLDMFSNLADSPCPHNCNCLQSVRLKLFVSCSHWTLRTITQLPYTTMDLEMKNSEARSIPENAFSRMYYLTYINLGKNNVSQIDPGAFQNLTFVEKIQLHKNSLSYFGPEHCQGFPRSLSSLRLDGNRIFKLQPGVFTSCRRLVNLKLSRNNLTRLVNGTFDGSDKLLSM
ncbi:keratocan-like [Amphiura filiformis]|uniref:keratocan-like n=1 Tax=Amphiura filiformis TaxID=82378 RepID=UPI003B21EBE4